MGGLSPMHLAVILVIVLLLFGNRMPGVAKSLGEGIREFKKAFDGKLDRDDEV